MSPVQMKKNQRLPGFRGVAEEEEIAGDTEKGKWPEIANETEAGRRLAILKIRQDSEQNDHGSGQMMVGKRFRTREKHIISIVDVHLH